MFCRSHFLRRKNRVSWKDDEFNICKVVFGGIAVDGMALRRSGWLNGEESCFNVNLKSGVHGVMIRRIEQTFIRHCCWGKFFPFVSGFELGRGIVMESALVAGE